MKLLIMQSYPASSQFLPLRSKVFSSAPCSQTPSVYVLPYIKTRATMYDIVMATSRGTTKRFRRYKMT